MSKFTAKIQKTTSGNLFLVTGKNNGLDAWYYILVDKLKIKLFEREVKKDSIELKNYGEVIYLGWGKEPPEDIRSEIKNNYS